MRAIGVIGVDKRGNQDDISHAKAHLTRILMLGSMSSTVNFTRNLISRLQGAVI